MRLQKVLCPTDFSPGSHRALRVAVQLATQGNAELVLIHVWSSAEYALPSFTYPAGAIEQIVADEERGLQAADDEARRLGAMRVTHRMLTGHPAHTILDHLREDPAVDLVVAGTHGRTGLSRFLLGSVAEKLVRYAPCPVLVTRTDTEPAQLRTILVPVDFSESSRDAMNLAAELVEPGGAGIALLHVVELPRSFSGEPTAIGIELLEKHATETLDAWAAELAARVRVPVTKRWRMGRTGTEVLAVLDAERFDLTVIGNRGRGALARMFLGSVAEKVIRHAPGPVLVAHRRT